MKRFWARFAKDHSGTSAVEFAIVGPFFIILFFWFCDVAFAVYVRNSFTHAVNEAAREVYLNPNRTDAELETSLNAKLARFGDAITVSSTKETAGAVNYHVISAEMTYHFKSPGLSARDLVLRAASRAPIITYKAEQPAEEGA